MNNDKITTIIFDLDGTLLYTLEDLTDAMNYILRLYDMPERSIEEVRRFVGNGIKNLIRRAVPGDMEETLIDEMFEKFEVYYDEHCLDKTGPYPGIIELIQRLKEDGYKLAIVSNKVDSAVKELNERFFMPDVKVAIGEKPGVERKPAPDTVYEALRELGSRKEEAIYIGDSEVDVATAKNSNIPCISVLWGFRDKEVLIAAGATTFAKTTDEVYKIIRSFND